MKSKEELASEAAIAQPRSSVVQVVKKKSKQQPESLVQQSHKGDSLVQGSHNTKGKANNKIQSFLAGGSLFKNPRSSPRHGHGARASPRYDRGQWNAILSSD